MNRTRMRAVKRIGGLLGAGVLAVSVIASAGCRTGASASTTVTPMGRGNGEGPGPEGIHEDDSVDSMRARLQTLVRDRSSIAASASEDAGVCEDLCSIATQICEVQVKLCEVADRYPQDDTYQNLCREAQQECREAQQSCIDCVQSHQRSSQPAD